MSWATLNEDEIKTRLSGPELTALQTASLAAGQVDPLPDVIAQVIDEIRGYIAVKNTLGPAGTIPPQTRGAAIAIVRWRLAGRLAVAGKSLLQGSAREGEYKDALTLLEKIVEGTFKVEEPEETGSEQINPPASKYGSAEKLDF